MKMNATIKYLICSLVLIIEMIILLNGDSISKLLNVYPRDLGLAIVIIMFMTIRQLSYYYYNIPKNENVKKYMIDIYSFNSSYQELFVNFEKLIKRRFYFDITGKTDGIFVYKKNSTKFMMYNFILLFDANKYDITLKKKIEDKINIWGNYYIIGYVNKSLEEKKFDNIISYYEDNKYTLGRYTRKADNLTILVDLEKKRLYVSKILVPSNINKLYNGSLKRLLTKKMNMEYLERKIIEK